MPGASKTTLSPGPGLHLAGRYDRVVAVGIARVWENVLDWEHLPALHSGQFHGITLLDSCAMIPDASICGLIFIHPDATYPEIRRVSQKAIDEYARRRGMSDSEKARFLGHLL